MDMKNQIIEEIESFADEKAALHSQRFFKTGKGEYAEGDLFYGLTTPHVRSIVKKYYKIADLKTIEELLHNNYHEVRCVALLLLVEIYDKAEDNLKTQIYNLYLNNVNYINNWDLVDITAYKIIGRHTYNSKEFKDINKLANTSHLWSNRIAVVSTMYHIKRGDFSLILKLSEKFLTHKHDLMQKAVGWMLREMGKVNEEQLYGFLDKHHKIMPRTMLRYSIERLPKSKKAFYMAK